MLVLSRERDEAIIIGDGEKQVVVTIVDIRGDKVRLGVEAPEEIPVHRQEVYDAIRRENRKAGETGLGKIVGDAPTGNAPAQKPMPGQSYPPEHAGGNY